MKRPRTRRLFQFSLRTMLVVVVVLSVWLGVKVREAKRQKATVAWVETNGGIVVYDYHVSGSFSGGEGPPGPKWLRDSIGVDYFATVVNVVIVDGHGDVTDVSPLSVFTKLESLYLTGGGIRDLSPLANLTKLKSLGLHDTRVTDLSSLAKLTKLEYLDLEGTSVTDLTPLAKLTKLDALDLERTSVTDVSPLENLASLRFLDLTDTQVTDEEVAKLQKALPNCEITYK